MANKSTTAPRRPRRMAREPASTESSGVELQTTAPKPTEPKTPSKSALLLELLGREQGATLDQMVEATRWQPHTTRAALTGFRKKGHQVISEKVDGVRTYRIASSAVSGNGQSTDPEAKADA